jgi:hypothetical protein
MLNWTPISLFGMPAAERLERLQLSGRGYAGLGREDPVRQNHFSRVGAAAIPKKAIDRGRVEAMMSRISAHWGALVGTAVLLAGCPQFFVYDLEEATVDTKTVETSIPEAIAGLVISARDVLTGALVPIANAIQNFNHDQEIIIETTTDGVEIWYTIDGSNPNPFSNAASTALFDADNPIALRGDSAVITLKALAMRSQFYPSQMIEYLLDITYGSSTSPASPLRRWPTG